MAESIECGVPVRELRGYVCMVCFSCFFLYLLSGVYVPSSRSESGINHGRLARQLLSVDDDNATNDSCNGLIIEGLPVDLKEAHVRT